MVLNTKILEPERTLLIAEKGIDINDSENAEMIVANERFRFISTMNPGGDFGKKELSPALRNRFTEIWCETCTDPEDVKAIIRRNVEVDDGEFVAVGIVEFVEWFKTTAIGRRYLAVLISTNGNKHVPFSDLR